MVPYIEPLNLVTLDGGRKGDQEVEGHVQTSELDVEGANERLIA